MRRSAELYDKGAPEEGERLAATVYILVHQGHQQTPLLETVGILNSLQLPDTRHQLGRTKGSDALLCYEQSNPIDELPSETDDNWREAAFLAGFLNTSTFRPRFEFPAALDPSYNPNQWPQVPFKTWWEQTVYVDKLGDELTRKWLTLSLRSQDGGSHVDQDLKNQAYLNASNELHDHPLRGQTLGSIIILGDDVFSATASLDVFTTKNAHWASMRQMAWELDTALRAVGL